LQNWGFSPIFLKLFSFFGDCRQKQLFLDLALELERLGHLETIVI
jgi:hypothetical protein